MARSNVVEFRAISQSGSVAPVGVSKQSLELLGRAESLLVNARNAGSDEMLELSYCAALRCAGALLNRDDASAAGGLARALVRAQQLGVVVRQHRVPGCV